MVRITLLLVMLLSAAIAFSQEKTFEDEVSKISKKIDEITKGEKKLLKEKLKKINEQLSNNEITYEEAEKLKKKEADFHANQIEEKVSVQEQKLQQLVQDKTNGVIVSKDENEESFKIRVFDKDLVIFDKEGKQKKYGKRTTSQFVFAMGVNNVLENNKVGSLNNSEYKFWQSHFYELGFTFKTRLKEEPSKAYFKYGVSFLWNNLRAKSNQIHVVNNDQTNLEVSTFSLSENRLRHVQMIFPMHLEIDFSKNEKLSNDRIIDNSHDAIRFGIGGFFGFKLGTRQYLEYENSKGVNVEEVQKGDFNMNTLNYGLSTYLSYQSIGLYVKYDLNPLFKNSETRNISLGIRFDLD
ncbi:conserved exported protein of unknown function [Tenacibaculum sp. 190524A02b]|uniref:hypothetical protein n=1 Tax=Tenacibaculum vairaonense TaxID=3137860 RepID=UPI0032B2F412